MARLPRSQRNQKNKRKNRYQENVMLGRKLVEIEFKDGTSQLVPEPSQEDFKRSIEIMKELLKAENKEIFKHIIDEGKKISGISYVDLEDKGE